MGSLSKPCVELGVGHTGCGVSHLLISTRITRKKTNSHADGGIPRSRGRQRMTRKASPTTSRMVRVIRSAVGTIREPSAKPNPY